MTNYAYQKIMKQFIAEKTIALKKHYILFIYTLEHISALT